MLCSVITVLLGREAGWASLQGRLGDAKEKGRLRGRTGRWVCVCLCMCGPVWGVLLPADLVIHQPAPKTPPPPPTTHIHTQTYTYTHIHNTHINPFLCPPPPTKGPSVQLSARPGISTLISHLWRPNELRLLVHLRDPTDYQTGGDHLSMARGGIYTADLAAKERRIKKGEEREE